MVGWGILLIIGTIIARYMKQWDTVWFYLHAVIQSLGFGVGLAGGICGFVLNNNLNADVSTHKGLGISILVLGSLQVCLIYKHMYILYIKISNKLQITLRITCNWTLSTLHKLSNKFFILFFIY